MITSEQAVHVVNYLATFVFALGGARFATERFAFPDARRNISSLLASALCSHGGGIFFRDTVAAITTKAMVMPSAFNLSSSWDTWTIALLAYICFREYDRNKFLKRIFSTRNWNRLFNMIDAAGLGIFVVAGIERSMNFYHVRNFAALVYLGWGTSVGGGIITTLLIRPHPIKKMRTNIPYYTKAYLLASLAAFWLTRPYTDSNALALVLAFFSSVYTYLEESYAEQTTDDLFAISYANDHQSYLRRVPGKFVLPVRLLLNPFKGIRIYMHTPYFQGGKRGAHFLFTTCGLIAFL